MLGLTVGFCGDCWRICISAPLAVTKPSFGYGRGKIARTEIMNSGETMTKTDLRQEERKDWRSEGALEGGKKSEKKNKG
jgi:hypothetical protein